MQLMALCENIGLPCSFDQSHEARLYPPSWYLVLAPSGVICMLLINGTVKRAESRACVSPFDNVMRHTHIETQVIGPLPFSILLYIIQIGDTKRRPSSDLPEN